MEVPVRNKESVKRKFALPLSALHFITSSSSSSFDIWIFFKVFISFSSENTFNLDALSFYLPSNQINMFNVSVLVKSTPIDLKNYKFSKRCIRIGVGMCMCVCVIDIQMVIQCCSPNHVQHVNSSTSAVASRYKQKHTISSYPLISNRWVVLLILFYHLADRLNSDRKPLFAIGHSEASGNSIEVWVSYFGIVQKKFFSIWRTMIIFSQRVHSL